jgi:hypothetical protein
MQHLLQILTPFLTPWHLLAFAIVGFLVFGAMGFLTPKPPGGPPWKTP